ncbi:gluconate 2-dehydrogenase subunit 3 family protein [Candidatus Palauibacter soopunensis]|uniref:gluconate 2-dehydrogenase subunit 3 family protein n=1 Tax=Candidatus Palauibacter soopunensis TaxID=3056739 RepID=UPI00239D0544|nr:gluconate 2-dehydrogenase subunit 3 family protein [Candidatus Palauibacter soopunensis]MDE2877949.1 gluconate 2-dehydrogenase subunit 3 family protein [Candidatus Palauibacter soopunensis]
MSDHERERARDLEREPEATEGLTRRRALQVLAAGAAGAAALSTAACMDESEPGPAGSENPTDPTAFSGATSGGNPRAAGTPTDPDLVSPVVWWDLVLTEDELVTLAALCDVIIPEDEHSPGAAALGAHAFIDEWVSAPYDGNREDLTLVRGGLVWLDIESTERFGRRFTDLTLEQKHAICDDICWAENAAPEYRVAARFFDRVRDLTSTAFWTTVEGMADLGFVGNRPMPRFDGPPPEVRERLGLA